MFWWLIANALAAPKCGVDSKQPLWVRQDMVNLRTHPSADAIVLGELRLGTKITRHYCHSKGYYANGWWHWVSVRVNGKRVSGYLYDTAVSPKRLTVDWDGDGVVEELYNIEGRELRVRDSNRRPHIHRLSNPMAHHSALTALSPQQTGTQLIQATWPSERGTGTDYFTYSEQRGFKVALQSFERDNVPASTGTGTSKLRQTVVFNPDKTAQVTVEEELQLLGEILPELITEPTVTTTAYCLMEGVYQPCPPPPEPPPNPAASNSSSLSTEAPAVAPAESPEAASSGDSPARTPAPQP